VQRLTSYPTYIDTNIFGTDYPRLELRRLYELIGASFQVFRPVAYRKYEISNEYYPYQHNKSTSSWDENFVQGSRLDQAVDAMWKLVIDIGNLSKADCKLLDERVTILSVDIHRFIAKVLKLPDGFILDDIDISQHLKLTPRKDINRPVTSKTLNG
jgi:hypothetical protein